MSEMIDKAALFIWLDGVADDQNCDATYAKVRDIYKEIQSGRFDVHIGEGISAETLEKIGKRVAEIRAEAAEKERDELRKRVDGILQAIRDFDPFGYSSPDYSTLIDWIASTCPWFDKELENESQLDVNQYLGKRDTL